MKQKGINKTRKSLTLFSENNFTVFKLFFPKTKAACFQIRPYIAHRMHFINTVCNSNISQIYGFQNHHQTKSNLHTYFYFSELIQKTQFATTDPVTALSCISGDKTSETMGKALIQGFMMDKALFHIKPKSGGAITPPAIPLPPDI